MDDNIVSAELILSCESFQPTLDFLTGRLKFRVQCIFPADEPQFSVLVGYGLRLQLMQNGNRDSSRISLKCQDVSQFGDEIEAPNGTTFVISRDDEPFPIPPLQEEFVVSYFNPNDESTSSIWKVGRAGMRYRDLIPSRLGGRYIASHIHIPCGGPVPDYVHFHKVKFQMIFCYRGWTRLVYEDQGPPFILSAGYLHYVSCCGV
jgi:hypothetical protein